MGTTVRGLDELIRDFRSLPERSAEKFARLLGKGALNIKKDWQESWRRVQVHGHIPHLIRDTGYDVHARRDRFSAEVGVRYPSQQGFLAEIITYGTLTSAPHDAGLHALEAEDPRYVQAVAELAQHLVDGSA